MEMLKVSGTSQPRMVAGAIASVLRREEAVMIQAVGAMAVNQTVKSIAVARDYLVNDVLGLTMAPSFEHIEIDGSERTAIRFLVTRQALTDAVLVPDKEASDRSPEVTPEIASEVTPELAPEDEPEPAVA